MKHKHCEVIKAWADGSVIQIKHDNDVWSNIQRPTWNPNCEYRASLAIVEGKPVFEGDVLYCTAEHCWICRQNGTSKFIVGDKSTGGVGPNFDKATWTPPKPKTITVTIPYDAAKEFSVQTFWNNQFIDIQNAIKEAIK